MKKIWIINHYASSMFDDRAGRHYWFAKKLKEKGYEVAIFCATTSHFRNTNIDTKGDVFVAKYAGEIPFIFIKTCPYKSNGAKRILNMCIFYKNIFSTYKKYAENFGKPDIILASSPHPLTMVAGIKIARKLKIPCICEVRDLWPEAIFSFWKNKKRSIIGKLLVAGEHWIYRSADALIFTKEGDIDYLKENRWTTAQGGDIDLNKCYYINNGVDLETFEKQVSTERIPEYNIVETETEHKFRVVYTGALRPVNNVANLLHAASILKKKGGYEDIQFLIYGDGLQFSQLKQQKEREGLDNVTLKGFVERKYIPYILRNASITILNYGQNQYNWSRGNSSNKLFEYMASGKPVISTIKCRYSIIEKYKCGIELAEDTPECLAKEIIAIYDMDKNCRNLMGSNARKAVENFDFNLLTDKLIQIFKQVI